MSADLLIPRAVTVKLSTGQTVQVREMTWTKLRPVLGQVAEISGTFGAIFREGGDAAVAAAIGARILENLPAIVGAFSDVAERLVSGCVAPLPGESFLLDEVTPSDFVRLLDVSIALTVTEELIRSSKAIVHRLLPVVAPGLPSAVNGEVLPAE